MASRSGGGGAAPSGGPAATGGNGVPAQPATVAATINKTSRRHTRIRRIRTRTKRVNGLTPYMVKKASPKALPRILSSRLDADGAAHPGAAQAAIARGVLRQVLLMVVLGEIELRRIQHLGGDGVEAARLELLVVHRLRGLRGLALRGRERVDAGAILRAHVVALAHALGRVVVLPERLQQLLVGDLLGVIDHQHHLVVAGTAGADLLVGRIGRGASGIADGGDVDTFAQLPELALRAPEAAHAEHRGLEPVRIRPLERAVKDEMLPRGRDRR